MNTILVPVKNLAGAKQRLAEVLTAEQRRSLAEAMLRDVLEALAQLDQPESIFIVTGDALVADFASEHRFDVIADHENAGETAAIALATDVTASGGSDGVLVIPADVPLITAAEIKAILEHPAVTAEVNEEALYHYLTFVTTPPPQTLFEGIQRIPAGHMLVIDRGGEARLTQYWDALPP